MPNIGLKVDEAGNMVASEAAEQLRYSIIDSLIKPEKVKANTRTPRFWAQESKMALSLIKKYPESSFWRYFDLPYKLNSLAFLMSERGKQELDRQYTNWSLTKSDYNPMFENLKDVEIVNEGTAAKNKFNVMDL